MKARSVLIAFVVLIYYLVFPGKIAAVITQSLSVSNISSSLDQSQEMEVDVNFVCSSCSSDSYLRGVFYPSGTSYFGYTQDNSGNWSNASGGSCTTFLKVVQTDFNKEGTWSGKLKVKPDKDSSYYNGPGEYLFKVGRYTPSCSSPSIWSLEATVLITGPTPTPTSFPTSTPIPTNSPTPKPTVTPTPTPTVKAINTPVFKVATPTMSIQGSKKASETGVLGVKADSARENAMANNQNKEAEVLSASDNKLVPKALIFLGIVFIFLCVIVIFYPRIKEFVKARRHV